MAEEESARTLASVKSLLNWLNTFDLPEAQCTKLEELSSGHYLLDCLKSVIPESVNIKDDSFSSENGPWEQLWRVMEEFCQCSLDKSLSLKEVQSGNEEHIARVVVLLLCIMAYSKDNAPIIEKIKHLDNSDQRDIMFYIQNTLANIKTNAVENGDMTSGINEPLPDLEEHASPSSLSQPSSPASCATPNYATIPLKLSYSTPRPPPKANSPKAGMVVSAFDSPAVHKNFRPPFAVNPHTVAGIHAASPLTFSSTSPRIGPTPFKLSTEVPRLRHRISVLEGLVETHRKNAHDYCSELGAKAEAYDLLLAEKNQLEEKLGHLGELRDIQDELDQANMNLSKTEKSLERLKSENESLRGYRDQVVELEDKLKDYDLTHSKLHEYKEKVDKMSLTLMEKTSALNELNVAHQTIQAQLQGKTSEMENLLQQSRESSREIKELVQNCKNLEEGRAELEFCLEKKTESEQSLSSANKELQLQIEAKLSELTAIQAQNDTLEEQLKSVEADYTSYRTHVDGTLQSVQKENESLKVKCSMKDGELEAETSEKESLSAKLSQLEKERQQLQEVLKKLHTDMDDKISSLTQERESLSTNLAAKESSLARQSSEKATVEKELASLTNALGEMKAQLESKEDELSSISAGKATLEKDLTDVRSDLSRAIERCEAKDNAFALCKAELAEKDYLIMALSSEKIELLGQLDGLQSNVEGMNTKHNDLVQDIKNLRQENTAIVNELDVIITKNTEAEEHRLQLQASKEELASQLSMVQQELNAEREACALKDATLASLSADKADLEHKVVQLQAECDRLSKEVESTAEEVKRQLATRDERVTTMEQENTSLVQQLKELESKKQKLEVKLSELESTLSDKDKELNSLVSSTKVGLEEKIAELEQKLSDKKAELEQHSSSLDAYKSQIDTMEGTISSLVSEKRALDDEKKEMESSYQNKSEADEAKVRMCHELVADFKTTVEQMKESLEERNKENTRLQSSLVLSEEKVAAIREKNEVAMKQFEEERTRMKDELLQLEQKLEKQRQESRDCCQRLSSELELSQQKYALELERLNKDNMAMQGRQDEMYTKLRDENTETLCKQNKLYEEVDKLREREQEVTALCMEYKLAWEKERECVLSANEDIEQLQNELKHYKEDRSSRVEQLQQQLDQVKYQLLKEQRQATAEKNTLTAQLSYASEKLRTLEKSNQFSPPPSRQSLRSSIREPPRWRTSSSISNFSAIEQNTRPELDLESQLQREFDQLSAEGSHSVIPVDRSQDEQDVTLSFRSSTVSLLTSEKSTTLGALAPSHASSRSSMLLGRDKDGNRISELQRRNSKALPHLKSSYPIETQTQRESPSVCDESIKNGSKHYKKNQHQETAMPSLSRPSSRKPVAFDVQVQPDILTSSTATVKDRKRVRDIDSRDGDVRSPASKSSRLVSGLCTPETVADESMRNSRTFTKELQRATALTVGLKLRDYLDKPDSKENKSSTTVDQSKQGAAFVVSPPKGKGQWKLPKRLQENLNQRRASVAKKQPHTRRETILKGKSAGPRTNAASARRNALKNKN